MYKIFIFREMMAMLMRVIILPLMINMVAMMMAMMMIPPDKRH